MASPLVPCPSCARHVRAGETACPFCASALPADLGAQAVPAAPGRLSRAAAFVFGASLSVAACSSEVNTSSGTTTTGGTGGSKATTTGTGPDDDGGSQSHYGTPAFDGGTGGSPDDDGGAMSLYGDPPMPDGGQTMDDGGGEPLYGSPPPPPKG
jgi:hypothetical protein